jgi:hypothetical protein
MYTRQGKARPTCHTLSMLGSRVALNHMYLMWSTYSNLSWSHQQRWTEPLLSRKRAPDIIHSTTTDRSAVLYLVSLPEATIEAVGVKPPSVDGRLLGLLDPYTSKRPVRSILAHEGQPIGRSPTQVGATTLEMPAFHIPLPNLPNQRSPLFT